ncbi:hypothetical protein PAPYR_12545 [Paratrimastix pyriformis]|uniref:Uncharacterized protein n=1 Tax=Paratrimastix pyriformis TaxID=342808 RepID=A0ABQ8U672_9EUKA|nr:hypothetical protein PAPYR_12545 [Paratrimastix pyriformis]
MLQDVMEERKENEEAYHQKKLDDKKFRQDYKKLKNMINMNDDEVLDPENINMDALLEALQKSPTEVLELLGSKKMEHLKRKLFEKQKKIEKQNEQELQDQVGAYFEDVKKGKYERPLIDFGHPVPESKPSVLSLYQEPPIHVLPSYQEPKEIPLDLLRHEGQLLVDSEKEEKERDRAIEKYQDAQRGEDILRDEAAAVIKAQEMADDMRNADRRLDEEHELAARYGEQLHRETQDNLTDIARRFNSVRLQKKNPREYRDRATIMMSDPVLRDWIIGHFVDPRNGSIQERAARAKKPIGDYITDYMQPVNNILRKNEVPGFRLAVDEVRQIQSIFYKTLKKPAKGSGVLISSFQDISARMKVLIGEIQAGNNSPELKSELYDILDFLLKNRKITKPQHNRMVKAFHLIR